MASESLFSGFRLTGRSAARVERVLAMGRAFLTVTALIAIYLDPAEPTRLQALTYGVLLGYAVYSLTVLAYVNRAVRLTPTHGRVLHGLDIIWSSALTFVSEAPVSPFFLFFLFAVLAAAYRWGFRETVGTAALTVGIFLLEVVIATAGPWAAMFRSIQIEVNRTILRVAYLLLTGVLLGYFAEQEKRSRAELAAIANAARQPLANLGVNGAVAAVARTLAGTFGATTIVMIIRDDDAPRASFWRWDRDAADPQRILRRRELAADEEATWLFDDGGRVWHALREADGGVTVRSTRPDSWRLSRARRSFSPAFLDLLVFRTVTAVNIGLANEWRGRIYLFDLPERGGLEPRLHFLEDLADHVTPGLTNVFLQRRLQARAGADERARVARELHDGAIQALFGIEMKVEAMRRQPARSVVALQDDLAAVQDLLRREVLSLRELMQALRPSDLDSGEQLPDVLATLVDRFGRDTGIAARFVAAGSRTTLSPARAIELVRIVQEALVNVRKHSRARNVLVRLSGDHGTCRLVIEDDGEGFEFEGRLSASELDRRRLGPAIIKERARIAGADLAVDSMPGAGARVELTVTEDAYA